MDEEEIWKPMVGYEGRYWISSYGRILSKNSPRRKADKILKPRKDWLGYNRQHLSFKEKHPKTKNNKIACMVAETFLGPRPKGMVVCHIDGNRANDHVSNLKYDTQKNNIQDKREHGTFYTPNNRGEKHPNAKLTKNDVRTMHELSKTTSQKVIAKMFGVGSPTVCSILKGKKWEEVYDEITGNKSSKYL